MNLHPAYRPTTYLARPVDMPNPYMDQSQVQYQQPVPVYIPQPQVVYVQQHAPVYVPQPVYTHSKRRQSIKTHALLAVATGGLGNVAYSKWANSKVAARYEW